MKARRLLLAILLAAACGAAVGADTSAALLVKADQYWSEGKLEQAQQAFEAAAHAEPVSGTAVLRLAGFQLARQQIGQSMVSYKQAIGLEPKNSKAWIGLALAYLHSSEPALAKAALDEAIRVDPSRKESLKPLLAKLDERAR